MRSGRPQPHTLAGAAALHALTGPDRTRFERHLTRCAACRREMAEFGEATARLAAGSAGPPPAALKAQTLAAAALVRQLPPAAREAGSAHLGQRPWWPRLAVATASACLVLAGVFGLTARSVQHRLDTDVQRSHEVAAVLTARDATMLDARVTTGGTATVVMSRRERALVFVAAGLRDLPSSKCYELWLLGPGGDKPAGMLPAPRQGRAGPVTAAGLIPGDRLGLSVEPAGGSPQPTQAMILELAL